MLQETFSPPLLHLLRPCREWSIRHKVKLMGTCGGPPHMLGENLAAVYPPELRCQSREAMLKAELEEASRMAPPPTEEPENRTKCPVNCVCEVRGHVNKTFTLTSASAPSQNIRHCV